MSVHRHLADADVYFISNRQTRTNTLQLQFRLDDKAPELWYAEDGRIEAASYALTSEGVRVPLHLDPDESVFVVFPAQSEPVLLDRALRGAFALGAGRRTLDGAIFKADAALPRPRASIGSSTGPHPAIPA